MLHRIITLTVAAAAFLCVQAQGVCTIKGEIKNDTLAYSNEKVKMVYLTRIDEYERSINIDSAKVKKGKYSFKYKMQKDEPVMLYLITGFDNGAIKLFIEPGKVSITTDKAAYPSASVVKGTPTNDLYAEYQTIYQQSVDEQREAVRAITESKGEEWVNGKEGTEFRSQNGALSVMKCNSKRIEFLLSNNKSPLAPLMFEREIINMIGNIYAQQIVDAIDPSLHNHPYYRSLSNRVLARDIKEGSLLPDITIPLRDGTKTHLSDYRGDYVLLYFWAGWCKPCQREMPNIKRLYDETREYSDKFKMVFFAVENDANNWNEAIKTQDIDREGITHGCDLFGKGSPVMKMLNLGGIPYAFLLNPEGKLISQNIRGEELIEKVVDVLKNNLYDAEVKK